MRGTWKEYISDIFLGILIIVLYFRNRKKDRSFYRIWLYVLLSFAFYIPVAVFAGTVPMLGMLMLPKTICYLFMIFTFYKTVQTGKGAAERKFQNTRG